MKGYSGGRRQTRKGILRSTVNGPKYQHHNVWLGPYEQYYVKNRAEGMEIDESHVISKIVEQFIAEDTNLEDRITFLEDVEMENVFRGRGVRRDYVDDLSSEDYID